MHSNNMLPHIRRHPSQLLTGQFCEVPVGSDVLHINESGIYAAIAKGVGSERRVGVGKYSFDYKCSAEYWHEVGCVSSTIFLAVSHPQSAATRDHLVYGSRSKIYSAKDGDFKHMCTTDHCVYDLVYHPYRDSYLVTCEDGIMELDSRFRPIARDIIKLNPWNVLPSRHSTMLYTAWYQNRRSYFSIHNVVKDRQLQIDFEIGHRTLCTLLERPGHPEVLSLIGDDLVVIDLWHAQHPIINYRYPESQHAIYVDSNIYISAMKKDLHVVDHRCGVARKTSIDYKVHNIWFANSQLFVEIIDRVLVADM